MANPLNLNLNYDRPVKIADDVYWVGFYDAESKLHCNPYLIVDGGEAALIDGGSRPDFPTVMMKILQTGITPSAIKALICHHFDPDLCGSVPNFEDIIDRRDLLIIADKNSHMFIRHYGISSRLHSLHELSHEYVFSSGRRLRFYNTPYAHCDSSFITFDEKTGVLFTSDLFGSYSQNWALFFHQEDKCRECGGSSDCPEWNSDCPVRGIIDFHKKIMPSETILRNAMEIVSDIPCSVIAPQHGSVFANADDIAFIRNRLRSLSGVGIDGVLQREK